MYVELLNNLLEARYGAMEKSAKLPSYLKKMFDTFGPGAYSAIVDKARWALTNPKRVRLHGRPKDITPRIDKLMDILYPRLRAHKDGLDSAVNGYGDFAVHFGRGYKQNYWEELQKLAPAPSKINSYVNEHAINPGKFAKK